MEFVGQRVLEASMQTCTLPVQPAAIEVGPGIYGREIISLDLSEYGDSLHTRHIRIPFSVYLKPRQFEWMFGEAEVRRLLPIFEIPLSDMSPAQAITAMRDPDSVLEIAQHVSAAIPDQSEAMEELLDNYGHLAGSPGSRFRAERVVQGSGSGRDSQSPVLCHSPRA